MKSGKINSIMDSELKHIHRDHRGTSQNFLRTYYNIQRRHDLSREHPLGPYAILKEGIVRLKKEYPDFESVLTRFFIRYK